MERGRSAAPWLVPSPARAGGIDVVFNAIGMDDIQGTLLLDMPLDDFAQPVIKATRSQFLTARAAARQMVHQGSGVILSITVAPSPEPYHCGFGVACAAVEGLWRSLAAEVGSTLLKRLPTLAEVADAATILASDRGAR
jgi:NAD(P)-dependent dehydrogenase (short-subunit alcohol dehydrogenase family)